MILDQLRSKKDFTHQESVLADFILSHVNEICDLSATDLAKQAFTSKATVIRLAQKIGFSGYQELKMKLIVESSQKMHFEEILKQEPITTQSRFQDLIEVLPGIYDKAVTNTNLTLSQQAVNRVSNYLHQAEQIDCYATGIAYHLAQTACFKFETLGKDVKVFESINKHYLTYRRKTKRVVLLITFTGQNQHIMSIAKELRQRTDDYIVALAGPYQETLGDYCDQVIEIYNRDSVTSLDVITSFISCNYILDLFFSLLLTKQYRKHVKQSLRRLEEGDM